MRVEWVVENNGIPYIGVISYGPLEGRFPTGKYRMRRPLPESARAERIRDRHFGERNFAPLEGMEEVGAAHGQGILQVALAWLLTKPLVTAPIVGANTVEQLQSSLAAVGFRLTAAEMQALDDLSDWGTA